MEAIWIIFVIIAVIMRILKAGDFKGKLPEDWGDNKIPPIFKDWEFPWEDEPEPDKEPPRQQPVRMGNEVSKQKEQVTGGFSGDTNINVSAAETQHESAYAVTEQDSKSADTDFVSHPLLNTDTIINGIIMSELLQPPKSKRPGWRNN